MDKVDYLMRDCLNLGLKEVKIDADLIIDSATILHGMLSFDQRAYDAIEKIP